MDIDIAVVSNAEFAFEDGVVFARYFCHDFVVELLTPLSSVGLDLILGVGFEIAFSVAESVVSVVVASVVVSSIVVVSVVVSSIVVVSVVVSSIVVISSVVVSVVVDSVVVSSVVDCSVVDFGVVLCRFLFTNFEL